MKDVACSGFRAAPYTVRQTRSKSFRSGVACIVPTSLSMNPFHLGKPPELYAGAVAAPAIASRGSLAVQMKSLAVG
jgi:hypothetical protein